MSLARAAPRALPVLLTLLLVALTVSITAVGVVTALLVVGTLVSALDPAWRARARLPLAAPILTFAGLTVLSALLAPRPLAALGQARDLVVLALFLIAVNGFRGLPDVRRALSVFFGAVSVVSLYALIQTWACSTSVALPPWAAWALRVKLEACRAQAPFRAKGFFSIYMTLGGSLLLSLSLLAAGLILDPRGRTPGRLVASVLGFVVLGLTYVRNAWLGLAIAVGVLVALTRRVAVLLPIVLAVAVILAVPSAFQVKLLTAFDLGHASASERLYFWDAGLRMVADAPVLGHGPGAVKRLYPAYKHPDAVRPRTGHLHNNLIQIAVERGLLGLTAWIWIWVAFFLEASRVYRGPARAGGETRALVAGSLAAVAGFLAAGLFEYNFGDSEVVELLAVVMALPFVVARDDEGGTVEPD